jgi:hypothetical protein
MSTLCSNTVIACIVNLWLQEDHVNREDSRDRTTEYSEYYSTFDEHYVIPFSSRVICYYVSGPCVRSSSMHLTQGEVGSSTVVSYV